MVKKCFIQFCRTGYISNKQDGKKISLFKAPKNQDLLQKWQLAVPKRGDKVLTDRDCVCEVHFEPELVIKEWTAECNGNVIMKLPARAKLAPGAVPSIFNVDSDEHGRKRRKARKRPAIERKQESPPPPVMDEPQFIKCEPEDFSDTKEALDSVPEPEEEDEEEDHLMQCEPEVLLTEETSDVEQSAQLPTLVEIKVEPKDILPEEMTTVMVKEDPDAEDYQYHC